MAFADLDAFKTALGSQREITAVNAAGTVIAGRTYDLWVQGLPAGVAPTASVVPTNATVGALGQADGGTGALTVMGARMSALNAGNYIICDRLVHSGGLSGIVTTAQTTNLPTAALTRYTSGEGVMIGLTLYSNTGSTATTVTAVYTNQAGTGSRVTTAVVFGSTGFNAAPRMILLPLQAGDSGVQSVQSVTVLATTGTAGNFGVTLFKPLFVICVDPHSGILPAAGYITGATFGGFPEIVDGACLFPILISGGANSSAAGALLLAEH